MKEKKWTDCPACGAKGSMKHKAGLRETYSHQDYPAISVSGLDGYFCGACGDGIYSIASKSKIVSILAEAKAKYDSSRVYASELLDVDDVAKRLSVSRQRIHQMMDEGKLEYVFVGKRRFPTRKNESRFKAFIGKQKRRRS